MRRLSSEQIMSISALITAVVAVFIAVFELQANREYQRLSVEPYLEFSDTNRNGYERILSNSGLGPARIQTVEVSVRGKDISNWKEAVQLLTKDDETSIMLSGLWKGRQIKQGELITLLHLKEEITAQKFLENSHELNMKICYCSIYKECWIKEDNKEPLLISQCPMSNQTSFPY